VNASGAVVRAADIEAERTETGATIRLLLNTGGGGAGLVRRMVDVPASSEFIGTAGAGGELWFVVSGTARLRMDSEPGPELSQDRGLLMPPRAAYRVTVGSAEPLRLDVVTLPSATGEPSSQPDTAAVPRSPRTADLADCDVETTGDRKFRVLFGPGRGCEVATQFVGEIPPGRAPEHSHPYDEVVMILAGVGVAHVGGAEHALAPGTCLHLPPGLLHCLENTGSRSLRVLGVFHPADSPAAKLLSHG
jgi:mannose-6-phosphate isomerase-like protein (cupin superfamily)